ncbi:peroxiredoxin [Aliiroseovarius sp. S2029]|uniref:peroxiredoxin n=1 Tax=Aliiroseovarius sp. S2029 TaxID=2936988 RepID=UPI0020BD8569|nr:peroxiredoxin [Aliiroseovarius sp. S2029]MCK8483355.1 peroxiredoxin [Aliiroseovarius sp. S2029]
MTLSVGDKLPDATLLRLGADGPEPVELSSFTKGKKVVIFALPGAYTGTCTTAHVPSFMRTKPDFDKKGVDAVICIAVNDPFVLDAWGKSTGATKAGITMLGDAEGAFTRAVGMTFDAPPAGLINRSRRYALYAEDGVVKVLNAEENPGVCESSGGEALLADLPA